MTTWSHEIRTVDIVKEKKKGIVAFHQIWFYPKKYQICAPTAHHDLSKIITAQNYY